MIFNGAINKNNLNVLYLFYVYVLIDYYFNGTINQITCNTTTYFLTYVILYHNRVILIYFQVCFYMQEKVLQLSYA